jgi:hypothetical protein
MPCPYEMNEDAASSAARQTKPVAHPLGCANHSYDF